MYNAVVISRLMCGIESLEFTESLKTRLNAFQMRGLRHILKIDHMYWSHVTNQEIIGKANVVADTKENITDSWQQILRKKGDKQKKIKLIYEVYRRKTN